MVAGILVTNMKELYSWRIALIIQGLLEIPAIIYVFFIENKDIDILCIILIIFFLNKITLIVHIKEEQRTGVSEVNFFLLLFLR